MCYVLSFKNENEKKKLHRIRESTCDFNPCAQEQSLPCLQSQRADTLDSNECLAPLEDDVVRPSALQKMQEAPESPGPRALPQDRWDKMLVH